MVLKKLFKLLLSALLVGAKMNFKKYHPIISETEALHSIDRHAKKLQRKFSIFCTGTQKLQKFAMLVQYAPN